MNPRNQWSYLGYGRDHGLGTMRSREEPEDVVAKKGKNLGIWARLDNVYSILQTKGNQYSTLRLGLPGLHLHLRRSRLELLRLEGQVESGHRETIRR